MGDGIAGVVAKAGTKAVVQAAATKVVSAVIGANNKHGEVKMPSHNYEPTFIWEKSIFGSNLKPIIVLYNNTIDEIYEQEQKEGKKLEELKAFKFTIETSRSWKQLWLLKNIKVEAGQKINPDHYYNEIVKGFLDKLYTLDEAVSIGETSSRVDIEIKKIPHLVACLILRLISKIISRSNDNTHLMKATYRALKTFYEKLSDCSDNNVIDFIYDFSSKSDENSFIDELKLFVEREEILNKHRNSLSAAKTLLTNCNLLALKMQIRYCCQLSDKDIGDVIESTDPVSLTKIAKDKASKPEETYKDYMLLLEKIANLQSHIELFKRAIDLGSWMFATKMRYDQLANECDTIIEGIGSLYEKTSKIGVSKVSHKRMMIKINLTKNALSLNETTKLLREVNSGYVRLKLERYQSDLIEKMKHTEGFIKKFTYFDAQELIVEQSPYIQRYKKILGLTDQHTIISSSEDLNDFFELKKHSGNSDQLNPEQKFQNALILRNEGNFAAALELLQYAVQEGCTYANAEIGLFHSGWLDHKLKMRINKAEAMELFNKTNTARAKFFMSKLYHENQSDPRFRGYKIESFDCPEEAKGLDPLYIKDEKDEVSSKKPGLRSLVGGLFSKKSTQADFLTFESQDEYKAFCKANEEQKKVIKKVFNSRTSEGLSDTDLKDYYKFLFSNDKDNGAKEFYEKLKNKGGKPRSYSLLGKYYFDCCNYELAMRLFEIGWYDYGDMFSAMYLFFYYEDPSHVQAEFSPIHTEKAKQFVDNWLSLTDKIDLKCPPRNFIKFSESLGLDDYLKKEKKVDIAKFRSDLAKQDNHNLIKDLYKKYTVETVEEHAIVMYLIYKSQMSTAAIFSRQDIECEISATGNPFGDSVSNNLMKFQRVTSKYGKIPCFEYTNVLDKEFKFEEGICLRTYSKRGRVLIERNRHEDAFACFKSGYDKGDIYSTPYLLMCYVFACGTKRDLVKAKKVAEKLGKFDINTHILVEICLDKINSMELDLDIYNFIDLIETKVGYYLANILRVLTDCITLDGIPRFFLKGVVDGTLNQNLKVEDPQNKSNIKESDSTYAVLPEQLCRLVMDCVSLIHGGVIGKKQNYDGLLKDIHNFITGKYEGESKLLKFKKSMSEANASSNNFAKGLISYNKHEFEKAKKYFGAGKENDPYCQQWASYLDYCCGKENQDVEEFLCRKKIRETLLHGKEIQAAIELHKETEVEYNKTKSIIQDGVDLQEKLDGAEYPLALLCGPSRVGKTTLANSLELNADREFKKEVKIKDNKVKILDVDTKIDELTLQGKRNKLIIQKIPGMVQGSVDNYFRPEIFKGEGSGIASTTKFGKLVKVEYVEGKYCNLLDSPGLQDSGQNRDLVKDRFPIYIFWKKVLDQSYSAVYLLTTNDTDDANLLEKATGKQELLKQFANISNRDTTKKQGFVGYLQEKGKLDNTEYFKKLPTPTKLYKELYKEYVESDNFAPQIYGKFDNDNNPYKYTKLFMDVVHGAKFRQAFFDHVATSIKENKKINIKDLIEPDDYFDKNNTSEEFRDSTIKSYFITLFKRFTYLWNFFEAIKGIHKQDELLQKYTKEFRHNSDVNQYRKKIHQNASGDIMEIHNEAWRDRNLYVETVHEETKEETSFSLDTEHKILVFDSESNFPFSDEFESFKDQTGMWFGCTPEEKLANLSKYKWGNLNGEYPFYYSNKNENKNSLTTKYKGEDVAKLIECARKIINDEEHFGYDKFINDAMEHFQVTYSNSESGSEQCSSDFQNWVAVNLMDCASANGVSDKNIDDLLTNLTKVEPSKIYSLKVALSEKDQSSSLSSEESKSRDIVAKKITEKAFKIFQKYLPSVYYKIFDKLRSKAIPTPWFYSYCSWGKYNQFLENLYDNPGFINDYDFQRIALNRQDSSTLNLSGNENNNSYKNLSYSLKEIPEDKQLPSKTYYENREITAQGCYYRLETGYGLWTKYDFKAKSYCVPYSDKTYVIKLFAGISKEDFKRYKGLSDVDEKQDHNYPIKVALQLIKQHSLSNIDLKSVKEFNVSRLFASIERASVRIFLEEKGYLTSSNDYNLKFQNEVKGIISSYEQFITDLNSIINERCEGASLTLSSISNIFKVFEKLDTSRVIKEIIADVRDKISRTFKVEQLDIGKNKDREGKKIDPKCVIITNKLLEEKRQAKISLLSNSGKIKKLTYNLSVLLGNILDLSTVNDYEIEELKKYYPEHEEKIENYQKSKEDQGINRYITINIAEDENPDRKKFAEKIRQKTAVSIYRNARMEISKKKDLLYSKLLLLESKFRINDRKSAVRIVEEYKLLYWLYQTCSSGNSLFSKDELKTFKILEPSNLEEIRKYYEIKYPESESELTTINDTGDRQGQPSDATDRTIRLNFDQVDKIRSFLTNDDDIHQALKRSVENSAITEAMRANLLERLQPNYFWREINEFNDEEKKQISNLDITQPMVNKPYETSSDNWEQGSYIIYSDSHFTAMHVEENQIRLFDSNSDTHPMRKFKCSEEGIESIERKQQEINDCWGRSFLYLTEDLANVECKDARSVMIKKLQDCYQWLGEQNTAGVENELKRAFDELWGVNEDGERVYKHENSMLDISIMDALLRWENAQNNKSYKLLQIREGQVYYDSDMIESKKLLSEAKWDDIRDLDFIRTHSGYETEYRVTSQEHDLLRLFKDALNEAEVAEPNPLAVTNGR